MENHVVLNFSKKKGIGIVLRVGFKQVWGIYTLFYESSFVFVISFSCDLLKRKEKEEEEKKRKEKKKHNKRKEKNASIKSKSSKRKKNGTNQDKKKKKQEK